MILHELVRYYRRVAESGDGAIAPEGWVRRPVDYFIVLARGGTCMSIDDNGSMEGKKRIAQHELVPAIGKQALKHTNSGKDANLLWDSAAFVLGFGKKGALKASSFDAELKKWFEGIDDPAITDLQIFLKSMQQKNAATSLIQRFGFSDDFEKRDPILAFRWQPDGPMAIHHRVPIRSEYEKKRVIKDDGTKGNCLVTGEAGVPIVSNETVIKGVWGAQTSGANIASFNRQAFESHGKHKKGGENAPISKQASFAYTTALNYLLSKDSTQRIQIGDASTVFWSEKQTFLESSFADFFNESPKDDPARQTRAVEALFKAPAHGLLSNEEEGTRFYVLGLAPNAARISVRFWHVGTVTEMSSRIRQHFHDLAIVHAKFEKPYLSLFRLLVSVASQGKSENIPPNLSGEFMRTVFSGRPYPQTMLQAALRRIRAEREVTYSRAALIKACLNTQERYSPSNEMEITVSLDDSNTNSGYRIGRLFATLEKVQEEASPNLNATIRDRFYGAASSTPVTVFATLMKLKNFHLAKLDAGRKRHFEKLIGQIMSDINDFPPHLSLADQGRFTIGYYHQRQAFFTKTEPVSKGTLLS